MASRTPDPRASLERRCRVLVENAADLIFTVDQGGACTFFNRRIEPITGRHVDELNGRHLTELVAADQREHVWRQCQRVLSGEDLGPVEFELVGGAGGNRTVEMVLRPVLEDGVVVAADAVARDVTSRNALDAAMRHEQKMNAVGRLAAGVAHDFNNLLGVILGHVEATSAITERQPALQPAVDSIRAAAERAASLTAHLLVLGRRQVAQPRVLDLNEVVTASRPLIERLVGEAVSVQIDLDAALAPVRADAGQLRQVVASLALHAQAAMPHGGTLRVDTANVDIAADGDPSRRPMPPGAYVRLTVADTGVGIDPAALEWIFEPFFQARDGRAQPIGLSAAYSAVRQAGGVIDVESHRGQGTVFRVYLPRVDADVTAPPPMPHTEGGVETILLVEDEDDLREILVQLLTTRGYRVVPAPTAEACLEASASLDAPPGLLVTDVLLPGAGGRELAVQLCARFPGLPVLFMSGYTDDAALMLSVERGAAFLQKPFGLQAFAARVRALLDRPQAPPEPADSEGQ
ncbi:MAG: PAS domain S-box protein [Vicinamibacterales bacterium]